MALSALASASVYTLAGGTTGAFSLPRDLPAALALVVVYYAVDNLLVAAAIGATSGARILPLLRGITAGALSSTVAESGLGLALGAFAVARAWNALTLLPLVLAVYQSHVRLTAMRRETVHALETFANVVDERDSSTYRHSQRVADHVGSLARALALPDHAVARLEWTARLHDLGKVAVDAGVLRKAGSLNEEEWAAMHRHPRVSARILRRFRFAAAEARAVEYHHERYDGRGYFGVDRRALPLESHLLIVADSFDAMTSDRPYRPGMALEQALAEIERRSGSQFHPAIARAFVALQRGEDPAAVLSPDERAELRRLGRRERARRPGAPRAEHVVVVAAAAALAAAALLGPVWAAPGGLLALVALARHLRTQRRARELVAALDAAAGAGLDAVALTLAGSTRLRWAGVVRWEEPGAERVEAEWPRPGRGPEPRALVSWLLREADAGDELLAAEAGELGRAGAQLALPLDAAFLVLDFAAPPGREVGLALTGARVRLADAFALDPAPAVREPVAFAAVC